jgi:hypothetical protein
MAIHPTRLAVCLHWLLLGCSALHQRHRDAAFGRQQGVAVPLADAAHRATTSGRATLAEQARVRQRCAPGSSSPTYTPWLLAAYWEPSSQDIVLSVSEKFCVDGPDAAQWTYALGEQAPSRVVKTGDYGGGSGARFVHFHAPDAALGGLFDVRNVTVSVRKAGGAPVPTELPLCHRDVFTGNSKHHYLAGHTIIKTSHVNDRTGYGSDASQVETSTCRFIEWVSHHIGLGAGHMFVHTHHDDAVHAVPAVQQLVRDGVLTLIPWNFDAYVENGDSGGKVGRLDPFLNAQEMALEDANHRFSARFDWIIMCDTDEFFVPKPALLGAGGLVPLLRRYDTAAHASSTCALQVPTRFVGSSGLEQHGRLGVRSLANGCLPLMTRTFTTACADFVPNGREKVIVRSRAKTSQRLLRPTALLSVSLHRVAMPIGCMVKVDPVAVMEVLHFREHQRGQGPYCDDNLMTSKDTYSRTVCGYSAVLQGDGAPQFTVRGGRRRLSGLQVTAPRTKGAMCLAYTGTRKGGTEQARLWPVGGDKAITPGRAWPWRSGTTLAAASAAAATIRALLRPVSAAPLFSARYLATEKGAQELAALLAQAEKGLTPAQRRAQRLQRQKRFDRCLALYAAHPTARVGVTWGSMRRGKQVEWGGLSCDEFKRWLDKARRELVRE